MFGIPAGLHIRTKQQRAATDGPSVLTRILDKLSPMPMQFETHVNEAKFKAALAKVEIHAERVDGEIWIWVKDAAKFREELTTRGALGDKYAIAALEMLEADKEAYLRFRTHNR